MKLTIGFAVFDDHSGLYMTIQALRMYHGIGTRSQNNAMANCELVVVDNNPSSRQGERVRHLLANVWEIPCRYEAFTVVQGTSAPRQRVFDLAQSDAVLCMDSHVMVPAGSIQRLIDFYEVNPGSKNLYSGPMLYDNLKPEAMAHYFDNVWGTDNMWGRWSAAWISPSSEFWRVQIRPDGQAIPMKIWAEAPEPPGIFPEHWPLNMQFHGHEAVMEARGWKSAAKDLDGPPFEIPAMGLGVFSCRKEAWLGFNHKFRGFGGEEWYIHEKFRRAGHKCICLPFLPWLHRFADGAIAYPASTFNKIRNYVIGHTELGIPLDRLKENVVVPNDRPGNVSPETWNAFTQNRLPHKEWDELMTNPADPPTQEQVQAKLGIAPAAPCPAGCPQNQTPEQVAAAESNRKATEDAIVKVTLEELYNGAAATPSDINEHVPKLRELSSQCDSVVEFGMRHGVSTVALLAGQPKRFTSYDINADPIAAILDTKKGACDFKFVKGNSLETETEPCDLLFIDTKHTASHVMAELTKHAGKVKRWIAFHDTQIFGENGEDGGPGLLPAIRFFLKKNSEWSVIYHVENNHGFTVISRDPADKPELPSTARQVFNFGVAKLKMWGAKLTGNATLVSEEVAEKRLDVCALCPLRNGDRCSVCGCWLTEVPEGQPMAGHPGRAMIAQLPCPVGKWLEQ